MSRLQTDEDGETEINNLYDSYKFEVLESGLGNFASKNTFIDYLKNIFPECERARKVIC
jgi:hypothetical protein